MTYPEWAGRIGEEVDSMDDNKVIIRVHLLSVDGARRSRLFNNVESARLWAKKYLGECFDISHTFGYAISGDGVCRITCSGVDIYTLLDRRLEVDDASL